MMHREFRASKDGRTYMHVAAVRRRLGFWTGFSVSSSLSTDDHTSILYKINFDRVSSASFLIHVQLTSLPL
jgi:hypothetical protein